MMPAHARLQWSDGHRYLGCVIEDEVIVGGRHGTVRVPGATVSRVYARFFRETGRVWIEALREGSVRVDGVIVQRAQLANGSLISIDALELQFWED